MTVKADLLTARAVAGATPEECVRSLSNTNLQSFIANLSSRELAYGANAPRDLLRVAAVAYLEAIHHYTRDGRTQG
jgi:hypothetical protein